MFCCRSSRTLRAASGRSARYDRAATQPNAQLLSSFVLHLVGGRWVKTYTLSADAGEFITRLAMTSPNEGWAAGGIFGSLGGGGVIWHDHDGTWSEWPQRWHGFLSDIAMVSPYEGWAVGGVPGINPSALLLHYSHGAWTQVPSPDQQDIVGIAMASPTEGWAIQFGNASVYTGPPLFLHDSGGVWSAVPNVGEAMHSYTAIAATSAGDARVADDHGALLLYTAGTLAPVASTTFLGLDAITMLSPRDGWAVGQAGVILHYDGTHWTPVASPIATSLLSIAIVSPEEGWAVGSSGTILQYNGGAWNLVNGTLAQQ